MNSPLPTISVPTYKLKLPVSGIETQYRPFLVKEEKILLIALENDSNAEMKTAIASIISNCTDGKLDPSTIPLVDVEYLFLHIRSKSVGDICEPTIELEDENGVIQMKSLKIPISEIEVVTGKDHTTDIKISDDILIRMRYPSFNMNFDDSGSETELLFDIIVACIDEIFQGEDSWKSSSVNPKYMKEFVERMTQDQLEQLMKFFESMPKIEKKITVQVGKKTHDITLSGLNDFFVSPSRTIQS